MRRFFSPAYLIPLPDRKCIVFCHNYKHSAEEEKHLRNDFISVMNLLLSPFTLVLLDNVRNFSSQQHIGTTSFRLNPDCITFLLRIHLLCGCRNAYCLLSKWKQREMGFVPNSFPSPFPQGRWPSLEMIAPDLGHLSLLLFKDRIRNRLGVWLSNLSYPA